MTEETQRLLFTTITRFGALTLVIYAASVLLHVFRYLMKLAAFARFRANALRQARELTLRQVDLYKRISEILAVEKIDFGKEPITPTENLVDLVRASVDAAKNAAKAAEKAAK